MAEYNSAFDAACCGGPTIHRWTPHPAMEECVVCQMACIQWPDEPRPCEHARKCEDFEEFGAEGSGDEEW